MDKKIKEKKIKFDFSLLEGKIKQYYDTQENFAKQVPMSRSALNNKLNNKTDFTPRNIRRFVELLHISDEEIGTVFFKEKGLEN